MKAATGALRWSVVVGARRSRAWLGSVVLHGGLLAAAVAWPPGTVTTNVDATETYELIDVATIASPPSVLADRASSSAPPSPSSTVIASPRPVAAPRRPAKPSLPSHSITVPPDDLPASEALPAEPEPPSAPREITLVHAVSGAASTSTGVGDSAAARAGAGDAFDHSAYGAELVRIVKREIDRNPVPGISKRDSVRVLLTVLPNGDLEWTRDGRFGFAEVLGTSLGTLRTRQILKRIESASLDFPPHPRGIRGRRYVVEVTIRFDAGRR